VERIDFGGQVAVVTGAGRGIGREYALLLASRGAAVVVNDLGTDVNGRGEDPLVAESVVNEIRAVGGRAVANADDVSTSEGGSAIVDTALNQFGRIDIMIHNAGALHRGKFAEMDIDDVHHVLTTHLMGAFHVGQPAWKAMARNGYGRILLTSSVALFGAPDLTAYSAAKAGCVSLANAMAREAERDHLDIKTNSICPTASTRRAEFSHRPGSMEAAVDATFSDLLDPRNIAPIAAFLVSRQCPVNGTCIKAGGTALSRIFTGMTQGWASGGEPFRIEDVQEHFDEAVDLDGHFLPTSSAHARQLALSASIVGDDESRGRI
jgi:NAD(P)-dependent dehydrogenase (short-subunit alcohol dehydrogenase family)